MHTADENSALRKNTAKNDPRVRIPNTRNTPATSSGYTGVSQAVGPVSFPNGELNPFPCDSADAIFPVSCANDAGASISLGILRSCIQPNPSRAPSATKKIKDSDVAA